MKSAWIGPHLIPHQFVEPVSVEQLRNTLPSYRLLKSPNSSLPVRVQTTPT